MPDASNTSSEKPPIKRRILGRETVRFHTGYRPTVVVSRPYVEVERLGSEAGDHTFVLQSLGEEGPDGRVDQELDPESTEGIRTAFRTSGFFPDGDYRVVERTGEVDVPVTQRQPRSALLNRRETGPGDDETIRRVSPAAQTIPLRFLEPDDATITNTTGGGALTSRAETPWEEMSEQEQARDVVGSLTPPDRSGYRSLTNQWVYVFKRVRVTPAMQNEIERVGSEALEAGKREAKANDKADPAGITNENENKSEGFKTDTSSYDDNSYIVFAREFWVDGESRYTETAHHVLAINRDRPAEMIVKDAGTPGATGSEPHRVKETPPPPNGPHREYILVDYARSAGEAPEFFFWSSEIRLPLPRFHDYGKALMQGAKTPPFPSVSFENTQEGSPNSGIRAIHGHTYGPAQHAQIVTEDGAPFTKDAQPHSLWGASVTLPSSTYLMRKRGARVLAALDRWGRWGEQVAEADLLSKLVDGAAYSETQGRSELQKILREPTRSVNLFAAQYEDVDWENVREIPTNRHGAPFRPEAKETRLHQKYYQHNGSSVNAGPLPDTLLRHWVAGYEEKGKQLINEIADANASFLQLLDSRPAKAALADLESAIDGIHSENASAEEESAEDQETDADGETNYPEAVTEQILLISRLFQALTLVEAHRQERPETTLKSFSELRAEGRLPDDSPAGSPNAGEEEWSMEQPPEAYFTDALGTAYSTSFIQEAVESLEVSVESIERGQTFNGDEFLRALEAEEDRAARARPAIAPSDLIGTLFKVARKSRKTVPKAFEWTTEALSTLITRMHAGQAKAALAVQQLLNLTTGADTGVSSPFTLEVHRRRIASRSVRQVQIHLSTADAESLIQSGNTALRCLDAVNVLLIAHATRQHAEAHGLTDAQTVLHGFRTGIESARFLLTEERIETMLRSVDETAAWSDEAVAAFSKSVVQRVGLIAGAFSIAVEIVSGMEALKDGQIFAAAGHGLYAAGTLVFLSPLALTSFLGVIGVAFFIVGGAFMLIQAWVNSQRRLEADPLSGWLPEGCVWGERYGAYKPAGAQEAVVPSAHRVAELKSLFGLLSETWTGDAQDGDSQGGDGQAKNATLSTEHRERITGQVEAFMEKAFAFPSEISGIEKLGFSKKGAQLLDKTVLQSAVEGTYTGGEIRMRGLDDEDPDIRYLQGLELRIRPEYLPKVGTLEVDLQAVKPANQGSSRAGRLVVPLQCIVHYVLDPDEDDPTYRYVVVGPGGGVPVSGDGTDLIEASRGWPTTRNEHYGDPGAMEILFVPEVPTQEQLNRTWPGTQEKMHLRVYGHSTHADAIRYTDPEATVAAPHLNRLFQQEQRTTGQVTVTHSSPTRPDQHPLHRFDYVVESPAFQVTGQVRFRPLQPLDLGRSVEDFPTDAETLKQTASYNIRFSYPHHSKYKGLDDVTFTSPFEPESNPFGE